jgi:hypothetical protein
MLGQFHSLTLSMKAKLPLASLLLAAALLLGGCDYDAPLTPAPTHPIDLRLLGDWEPVKPADPKDPGMHVRQWDEATYAVAIESDVYRVFHSDFAGTAFVSAQDLNSSSRKYCYYTWSLSADGTHLTLRRVRNELVPEKTTPAAAIQQLIKANLANPKLLDEPLIFIRIKPRLG